MDAASATDDTWRAARSDPDAAVRAAANALLWSELGIEPGSAAAAAVTARVIDAFRATFDLPPMSRARTPAQPASTPHQARAALRYGPRRSTPTGRHDRSAASGSRPRGCPMARADSAGFDLVLGISPEYLQTRLEGLLPDQFDPTITFDWEWDMPG